MHRSRSESTGEEKWRLNTCAFETSTIMINESSCPKYYFQMMNNCSIWTLTTEERAKRAQILEIAWNAQPAQLKLAEWEMQMFVSELARLLYFKCWNEIVPWYTATAGAQIHICKHWGGKVESKRKLLWAVGGRVSAPLWRGKKWCWKIKAY